MQFLELLAAAFAGPTSPPQNSRLFDGWSPASTPQPGYYASDGRSFFERASVFFLVSAGNRILNAPKVILTTMKRPTGRRFARSFPTKDAMPL